MESIYNIEILNSRCKNTMMEHLGIEIIEASEGRVVCKMPIDERTIQPLKRLHGGATMALAESVGSVGSYCLIDQEKEASFGVEINGSHVRTTTENEVFGIGTITYRGKNTHVWDIRVEDKNAKLLSLCRLTVRVVPLKSPNL